MGYPLVELLPLGASSCLYKRIFRRDRGCFRFAPAAPARPVRGFPAELGDPPLKADRPCLRLKDLAQARCTPTLAPRFIADTRFRRGKRASPVFIPEIRNGARSGEGLMFTGRHDLGILLSRSDSD